MKKNWRDDHMRQFHLYVSPSMQEDLRNVASKFGTTMTEIIEISIQKSLEEHHTFGTINGRKPKK